VNRRVRTLAAVAAATALTVSVLAASALALPATANASTFGGTTPFRPTDPGFVVAELPGGSSRARDGSARQLELSRSDPQLARTPEVAIRICLLEELTQAGPFARVFLEPRDPERAVDWLGAGEAGH